MKTQADSTSVLGTPPGEVEPLAPGGDLETSFLPPRPAPRSHSLRIRVYDYCPEHGYHTDPELPNADDPGL